MISPRKPSSTEKSFPRTNLYYELSVSSQRYHGSSTLTYGHPKPLPIGTIVSIPLQKTTALGVVVKEAFKPSFATKPISKVIIPEQLPVALLSLHAWIAQYYPAPLGIITQLFVPTSLSVQPRAKKQPLEESLIAPKKLPPLTEEQTTAVTQISNNRTVLLHGDTGTGKTRVYLELATHTLESQKSALILTPEIGLTPQLAHDFEITFPGKVITIHSNLTNAERRDAWLKIVRAKEPIIVIGPRSALFSPIHNLGLIVIDEAHDSAYKQEQMPYYQTSRIAAQLAKLHGAKLILGTATPLVGDYYAFQAKRLPIIRMRAPAVASEHGKSKIQCVNLRDQTQFTRSQWISTPMIESIGQAIQNKQQSLIFLNRRGSARLVLCQVCGWQAACPRCDLPLTFHADAYHLRCHTCGHTRDVPTSCEQCGSADIVFRSVGTKSIVSELQKLFSKAVIRRFDSDNTKAERLEKHYQDLREGKVDIIIGTQMLSKGLDLPKLAVVGVVVADTNLYFPDYTADERTYQMLTQVIGRVGRGHQSGTVIIQSYHPDSTAIQTAVKRDYEAFYQSQLEERERYRFPPFYYVLKLSCNRAGSKAAQAAAEKLAQDIRSHKRAIELIGPSPAFTERINNRHYWQLIIKSRQRTELLKIIDLLPPNWSYDIDPTNLL